MVLDGNVLKEKLIEAWKVRSNETSFSAALSPLIAECRSEEEFRTLFTQQVLANLDSATSSTLLRSYFKFHTRSGYINESLVIEHLLSLTPTSENIAIQFLLELLFETLKSLHVTAERGVPLARQLNALAKWLCTALCVYSSDEHLDNGNPLELLILVSNLFLLLFTNTTYYCLWLMIIKGEKEQNLWRQFQEQLAQVTKQWTPGKFTRPEVYEQVLFKITRLHLSEEFHQEDIEFNPSIFNPLVSLLVINQLHRSSSILLVVLRFYEHVSTMSNPSVIYLRFLQASFGGYLSSILSNNSEYQQRWSAYLHFQLPRLLGSCLDTQFARVRQAIENFLLYNEYLLNRVDELAAENVFEGIFEKSLTYTNETVRTSNEEKIQELTHFIRQARQTHVQQRYQNQQTHSYSFEVLQSQRALEKSLSAIFTATEMNEEHLAYLLEHLTDAIPLICAVDHYYSLIRLLLSYTDVQFDLVLYLLCYVTSISDDISEDFGHFPVDLDRSSSTSFVYVWLKKYWLARARGHALFSSSLESIDFLSTMTNSFAERSKMEKEEFLVEIHTAELNPPQTSASLEYLSKTIALLGELQSLALEHTKQTVVTLINYLSQVSHGSLVHVLLWLIANYQIANDDDKPWIQNVIHTLAPSTDQSSVIFSLFDALKRQVWSDFIDNPLVSCYPLNDASSSAALVRQIARHSSQTASVLIEKLFETFLNNEFLDSDQSRALFVCSKSVPIDLLIIRILTETNASNGIYETGRALFFLFGLILFRRRSSSRSLFEEVFPYLFNMKSNEFMLEPHVYSTCLMMSILLLLELHPNNEPFPPKPWNDLPTSVHLEHDDNSVIDAYRKFLDYSEEELFSSETLRPVNYFLDWFQTILWMFSRTVPTLKPFVKPKLVAQLSEYLPLQFPIEKVLSILDLSTEVELQYASMVITRDYTHLRTVASRTTSTLIPNIANLIDEQHITTNLTKSIAFIPDHL